MLVIAAIAFAIGGTAPREVSKASTTVVQELKQIDAAYGSLNGEEESHYVTISWRGTAEKYILYQVLPGTVEREEKLSVIAPIAEEPHQFLVTINRLKPELTLAFRIYECDETGAKLSEEDPGVTLRDVKTLPDTQETPQLGYWYRSSNKADFLIGSDAFSEGYQVRAETYKGKKLATKTVGGSAASGGAVSLVTLKPSYRGKVVHVKVRGFITVNGVKKYGNWSEPYTYASAKKIKLSGYKDAITVSGMKVKGAKKKEIYISKKEKKGFKLAKTVGSKTTSCKVSQYGKKYVHSDRTYYVRIYYYYKVNGKLQKSEVYDKGKVYIKPTYFYLPVG